MSVLWRSAQYISKTVPGLQLRNSMVNLGAQASCLQALRSERLGQSGQDACAPRGSS